MTTPNTDPTATSKDTALCREDELARRASRQPAFNLCDEAWLPVRYTDGSIADVGLEVLFRDAHRITALAADTPLEEAALTYFLVACTYLVLEVDPVRGEAARDEHPTCFDPDQVTRFFTEARDRFWLFHPEHPFAQVPGLLAGMKDKPDHDPPKVLTTHLPAKSRAMWWFQQDDAAVALTCAEAARGLLVRSFFAEHSNEQVWLRQGTSIKFARPHPLLGAGEHSPLNVWLEGATLHDTLVSNLLADTPAGDRFGWENDTDPVGQVALTTWSPKATLLIEPDDGSVTAVLRSARLPKSLNAKLAELVSGESPYLMWREERNGTRRVVRYRSDEAAWRQLSAFRAHLALARIDHPASVLLPERWLYPDIAASGRIVCLGIEQGGDSTGRRLDSWQRSTLPADYLLDEDLLLTVTDVIDALGDAQRRLNSAVTVAYKGERGDVLHNSLASFHESALRQAGERYWYGAERIIADVREAALADPNRYVDDAHWRQAAVGLLLAAGDAGIARAAASPLATERVARARRHLYLAAHWLAAGTVPIEVTS